MNAIFGAHQKLFNIFLLIVLTACGSGGMPLTVTQTAEMIPPRPQAEISTPTVIVSQPTAEPPATEAAAVPTEAPKPEVTDLGGGYVFTEGEIRDPEGEDVTAAPGGIEPDESGYFPDGYWVLRADGTYVGLVYDGEYAGLGEGGQFEIGGKTYALDGETVVEVVNQKDGSVVEFNADNLPTTIMASGEQIALEHPGVWIAGEEVRWWNKNSDSFEVMEHIKPEELVYQGNWVTGVVTVVPGEKNKEPTVVYPVAVADLANGFEARGDFMTTAEHKIIHNCGLKLDGVWHTWDDGSQTWQPVSDELIIAALDFGYDPTRTYEAQKWADGTYLVDTYNGARIAKQENNKWEEIKDIQGIYENLIVTKKAIKLYSGDVGGAYFTDFSGIYVDYYSGIWFDPNYNKYAKVDGAYLLAWPNDGEELKLVLSMVNTSNGNGHLSVTKEINIAGGIGTKPLGETFDAAVRKLDPVKWITKIGHENGQK